MQNQPMNTEDEPHLIWGLCAVFTLLTVLTVGNYSESLAEENLAQTTQIDSVHKTSNPQLTQIAMQPLNQTR